MVIHASDILCCRDARSVGIDSTSRAGIAAHPGIDAMFDRHGSNRTVQPGCVLQSQGDPIESVFVVLRGTVRSCLYTEDGDRQIVRFAGPGSIFGLTDIGFWRTTVETVDCAVIRSMPKTLFEDELRASEVLRLETRELSSCAIAEREWHLVTLAYLPAVERVCLFLENFARGRPRSGFVSLPMTRKDIADHLGLSIETVSRAFTTLRQEGCLELKGANMYRLGSAEARIGEAPPRASGPTRRERRAA